MSANQSSPSVREHEPLSAGSGEGAFPTINSDDARPSRSGEGYGQSSGPARSFDPVPGLTSVSYTCAYWDFLHGRRAVPKPEAHGLIPSTAKALRMQIETEWEEVRRQRAAAHAAYVAQKGQS